MTIFPQTFARRPSRAAVVRLGLLLAIVSCGWLLVYQTPVGSWLTEQHLRTFAEEVNRLWWAPLLLIFAYLFFGLSGIPSAPLFVAGAVFGPWLGTTYNLIGLTLGAVCGFTLARQLGHSFVIQAAGARYYKAQRFITRFGFWPLVQARFLPIPDTLLNFSAALSGIPLRMYLAASVVGILPSTFIHTLCISKLLYAEDNHERALIGVAYLGAFVVMNLLIGGPWLLTRWRRRQRYYRLRNASEARAPRPEKTTV